MKHLIREVLDKHKDSQINLGSEVARENIASEILEVLIENGERIAQGELVKTLSYSIEETKDVPEQKTNRVGGFGSTGVK